MCHTHWRQYTNALRKAAVARKTEASTYALTWPALEVAGGLAADDVVADPSHRRCRAAGPQRRVPETGEDAPPDEG